MTDLLNDLCKELHTIVHQLASLESQHRQYIVGVESSIQAIMLAEQNARELTNDIKRRKEQMLPCTCKDSPRTG